ncbi:MAG: ATP-binding protein [Pseudomonadota bacterium]|nr:ATP-binding protein [Pseudomonadota bacterium]
MFICIARALRSLGLWLVLGFTLATHAAEPPVIVVDKALAIQSQGETMSFTQGPMAVGLPDDWAQTRPRYEGSVLYRVGFDRPQGLDPRELVMLYIEKVCSNLEVYLNGQRIYSGGHMREPVARNCYYPQLVTLPSAQLQDHANLLELVVHGHALQRVASRGRAAQLSVLRIGPESVLTPRFEQRRFWSVTMVEVANLALAVLGAVMIGLGWMNRREAYLGYFGWLCLAWGALSARIWLRDLPWDNGVMEFLFCAGFAPLVALAIQFLLSFAGLRSRWIENALAAQWVLLPATLLLAGPSRLFLMSSIWYSVLCAEVTAATALNLVVAWRAKRTDFWSIAALQCGAVGLLGLALATHFNGLPLPDFALLSMALPVLFFALAARLLQIFARSMRAAEDGREDLETRVRDITVEIERNFAQLAELRVEQVTERERKRIAADLHDDLGAKLLTIVHTSESERISTLAREALEEMRLSVRGLTGKPMRLADALADWRAETVSRLGQANIEADWRGPTEEIEQLLPARGFVQTTRILREAVSNIIKHSGASHCKVRCAITERQFGLTVQDNGKGIPMELDGKLDRGHGMSSMKHRAKQMQGQCLVESGPGYGTVIRLTLPL